MALACVASWQSSAAWSVNTAPARTDESAFEPAIVAVTVNGTARGDLFIHRSPSGRLVLRREDLPSIGLLLAAPADVVIDGVEHVALEKVPGISLALDEPTLTLTITADPRLLARSVIQTSPPHRRLERLAGEGALMNWAIEQTMDPQSGSSPAALSLEAGVRMGPALFLSRSHTVADARGTSRLVRLTTSLTRDAPEQLVRWTLGDLVTSSDELGQGVLMGGVSLGTLARLDPYRVRSPLGTVQGEAALPSEVDVYVDGQRVRTERVPAGVFEIRDLHTPLGARSVQLVVRDPYGRVQRFDQSVYASQRLLAPGVRDFHYALGGLRRRFGQGGSDYGAPVFTARHAWGATTGLTLGLRAEGQRGLATGGASLTLKVRTAGLLSAAVSASQGGTTRGQAGQLRYDYQSARWGLGVTWRADSPGYATLGESPVLGNRRHETQIYASHALGAGRTVWVSHTRLTTHLPQRLALPDGWQLASSAPRHGVAIGYAAFLRPWGGSLRLTASRLDDGRGARNELGASLVFVLGGGELASVQVHQGREGNTQSLQWSRPPPPHEGWGYDLAATREGGPQGQALNWRAATQLESPVVRLRADLSGDERSRQHALRLSAAGGLAVLRGHWYPSRPMGDAYAVVEVGELAGIPVTVNGMPAGSTDTSGRRFIPQLSAHHETVIEIDPRAVPIDQTIAGLQRRVVLPERSGALIRFEAQRLRALAAQLVAPSAAGARPIRRARVWIGIGAQAIETTTGAQGELYLENLSPGAHHGIAQGESGSCHFELIVPRTDEVLADLGALACTPSANDQNRSVGPR